MGASVGRLHVQIPVNYHSKRSQAQANLPFDPLCYFRRCAPQSSRGLSEGNGYQAADPYGGHQLGRDVTAIDILVTDCETLLLVIYYDKKIDAGRVNEL